MSYKIGSFNTHHFSGVGTHDLDMLARIITDEAFDIVALQEVKRSKPIEMLLARLPRYWAGSHGKSQGDKDFGEHDGEGGGLGFAYLWNTRRVRECSKDGHPEILTHSSGDMARKPFYGRFTPSGLGGPFCEFRLVNVHLWYGTQGPIDCARRMKEFKTVTNEIYTYLSRHGYGNNMQAFTIILGDYNLSAVECRKNASVTANYYVETVQEKATTLPRTGTQLVNDYDHFSYDLAAFLDTVVTYDRIDTVEKYYGDDFDRHRKEISDHVPIKIELDLNPRR